MTEKNNVDSTYPNTETATLVIGATDKSHAKTHSNSDNSTTCTKSEAHTETNSDPLRKLLEEKSKKYSHLPVYDREEEARRAKKRQAAMSAILTDVDKQLGAVTSLTSSHMADKGVTMVPSPTPFDEPPLEEQSCPQSQGDPPDTADYSDVENTTDSKTEITQTAVYSELENTSDSKPEVYSEVENTPDSKPEVTHEESKVNVTDVKLSNEPTEEVIVTEQETTYGNLGVKFQELTEKMEIVTKDIQNEPEIPFIDGAGESEDYTKVPRTSNVRGNHQRSKSWQFMRLSRRKL